MKRILSFGLVVAGLSFPAIASGQVYVDVTGAGVSPETFCYGVDSSATVAWWIDRSFDGHSGHVDLLITGSDGFYYSEPDTSLHDSVQDLQVEDYDVSYWVSATLSLSPCPEEMQCLYEDTEVPHLEVEVQPYCGRPEAALTQSTISPDYSEETLGRRQFS